MDSEQVGTDLAVPESKSEEGRLQSGGDGEDTNLPKVKIITSCRQRFLSNIMRLGQWGQNSLTFSNTLQFHSFHSFMSINRQTPQPRPPLCADVRYISRGAPPWETDRPDTEIFIVVDVFPLFHFQWSHPTTFWTNLCSPCQLKCMLLHSKQMQN